MFKLTGFTVKETDKSRTNILFTVMTSVELIEFFILKLTQFFSQQRNDEFN